MTEQEDDRTGCVCVCVGGGGGGGDDRARGRGQCRGLDRAGGTLTEQEDDDRTRGRQNRWTMIEQEDDRTGGR